MEAIGVCGSGVFFERENEFFGMSMSTDWERDDGVVYTGSINLVRSWTTTGRYGTFLSNTLFFFTHIVISDRTKVGCCMDMDLPVISRPFSVIH